MREGLLGKFSTDITFREALQEDESTLWEFLTIAAYRESVVVTRAHPRAAAHLLYWKRPEDFGFIAQRGSAIIGAAWARQYHPAEAVAYYSGEQMPEITIGMLPGARGLGVGTALIDLLKVEADRRELRGLCLNVRVENPARRLYERSGFTLMPHLRIRNSVGGYSDIMLWDNPAKIGSSR